MSNVLAVVLSVVAFAFSLFTWWDASRRNRRDLFLKLHERLVEPELRRGRELLINRVATVDDAGRLSADERELAGRALAWLDIFAMYTYRRFIDRDLVLQEWGRSLAAIGPAADRFLDHTEQDRGWKPWPNLRRLSADAADWVARHPHQS